MQIIIENVGFEVSFKRVSPGPYLKAYNALQIHELQNGCAAFTHVTRCKWIWSLFDKENPLIVGLLLIEKQVFREEIKHLLR